MNTLKIEAHTGQGGASVTTTKISNSTIAQKTPIRAANGQVVGKVENGEFRKNVKASRHMLHSPRGWALDTDSLVQAKAAGAVRVVLHEMERDEYFSAPVSAFDKAIPINRGFGAQLVLPLNRWGVQRAGQPQQMQLSLGVAV